MCLSLGGQPKKLWLAHQIQNLLNFEENATGVEAIANFRQRFPKEILEAAGKLATGGHRGEALRRLSELVLASKIEPSDAEKMREIALTWWNEMPRQSLMNQMFARGCPGEKYPHQTIAAWIKFQPDLLRQRLVELCQDCDGEICQKSINPAPAVGDSHCYWLQAIRDSKLGYKLQGSACYPCRDEVSR